MCAVHADKRLLRFINTAARAPYSNGNISGLPAANEAQFHRIIATGKGALCVLRTSGLTAPWNFSTKCIFTLVLGRIHLERKLCSNKATQRFRNQMFCSLIFFFNDAVKFIVDTRVVASSLCLSSQGKRAS